MSNTRTVTAEIFGTKKTALSDFKDVNVAPKKRGRPPKNKDCEKSTETCTVAAEPQDPLNTYVSIRGFCQLTNFPENQIRALVAREAVPFLRCGPKCLLPVRDVMERLSEMAKEHADL